MKYFAFLLFLLNGSAYAQQGVQVVHEVATSTSSLTQTISLCTSGAVTDVATATSSGTLNGAFAIEVYNIAASTNTVNCGFDLSLSTQTTSAWYGREVPAGLGVVWQRLSNRKLYCETQNSGGCTRVTVTQMK